MSTNVFKRLLALLPTTPLQTGQIQALHSDGTATVELAGATGTVRVRNPQGLAVNAHVFVQGDAITGPAPALTVVSLEI
jgi:hypothetical protein